MLRKFKEYLFFKKLDKLYKVHESFREKELIPYNKIKNILIVFDASDEHETQTIFNILNEIKDDGKQTRAIGYVKWKQIPHFCIQKLSIDYILEKQTNFYLFPKTTFIDEVISEKFDILIDFTKTHILPIMYVTALSRASIKITSTREKEGNIRNYYDIIISEEGISNKQLYSEIKKYLNILKKTENQ